MAMRAAAASAAAAAAVSIAGAASLRCASRQQRGSRRADVGACIGVETWRSLLLEGDRDEDVLGFVEGDAEGCVREAAAQRERGEEPSLEAATCGLPALLSLELLHVAWTFRRLCLGPRAAARPLPAECGASAVLAETSALHEEFRPRPVLHAAGRAPESVARELQRCLDEFEAHGSQYFAQTAAAAATEDRVSLFRALLDSAVESGLGRRVLQWRANALLALVDFGLAAVAVPRLKLSSRVFPSRVEVLLSLLGGSPSHPAKVFAEVGVHLGRLSFALMSRVPGLRYIGIDPYAYGNDTSLLSVDRQLRDLGHQGVEDASALSSALEAAAEKFRYFGQRAELWVLPSVEAARLVPDASLDGVFIDGDHSFAAVAKDIDSWERTLRPGGFLSGHDFGNTPDVARAVVEHAERHNRTIHLAMDWVWYWRVP